MLCTKCYLCENCGEEIKPLQKETGSKHIVNLYHNCMPSEWIQEGGWKIEDHDLSLGFGTGGDFELDLSKIQFHFSSNQIDGKTIEGNKLRKELEKNKVPVLNACVLDYLLLHPELIPEDWKKDEKGNTRYIFFWGTVYRFPDGRLYVRYLYWLGGAWDWRCRWLVDGWDFQDPAAILK